MSCCATLLALSCGTMLYELDRGTRSNADYGEGTCAVWLTVPIPDYFFHSYYYLLLKVNISSKTYHSVLSFVFMYSLPKKTFSLKANVVRRTTVVPFFQQANCLMMREVTVPRMFVVLWSSSPVGMSTTTSAAKSRCDEWSYYSRKRSFRNLSAHSLYWKSHRTNNEE